MAEISDLQQTKLTTLPTQLVTVGWAWINGSDGSLRASSGNVTTARTGTGVYTATLSSGVYTVAQCFNYVNAFSIPFYAQVIPTSATLATINIINRLGSASDQDVLIVLEAIAGAPISLSDVGWALVSGAVGAKSAGSVNVTALRTGTGAYTVTLTDGLTHQAAAGTLEFLATGNGVLLTVTRASGTAVTVVTMDTVGNPLDSNFLLRFLT